MGVNRWLNKADERNQRRMDYVRTTPESGWRLFPFVESPAQRRLAGGLMVFVGVASLAFGIVGGLVTLVVVLPILWRLDRPRPADPPDDDAGGQA